MNSLNNFPVSDTEEVEAIKKDFCYNGKKTLKLPNLEIEATKEQEQKIIKCYTDIVYFCNNYVKIGTITDGIQLFKTYEYQNRMLHQYKDERFNIAMLPRQMGKSTVSMAFLLHYVLTNPDSTVAILANKERTAIEILSRLKFAYEQLPWFLKPGVIEWNKKSIILANGEKGCKIFAAACSADSIRGESCVTGDTKVCVVTDDESVYHSEISKVNDIPTQRNMVNKKYWIVYKATNIETGKFYIGCHGTNDLQDGYLGSGKELKKDIKIYGTKSFHKENLFIFDNQKEAIDKEEEIIRYGLLHYSRKEIGKISTIPSQEAPETIISLNLNGNVYPSIKSVKSLSRRDVLLKCGNPECRDSFFIDPAKQKEAESFFMKEKGDK